MLNDYKSLGFNDWIDIQSKTFRFIGINFNILLVLLIIVVLPSCVPSIIFNWFYPYVNPHHYKPTLWNALKRYQDSGIRSVYTDVIASIRYTSLTLVAVSLVKLGNQQKPASLQSILKFIFFNYARVFVLVLLLLCIKTIGLIIFIIPGLYMIPIVSITSVLSAFEGQKNPIVSLKRGFKLIKGNWIFVFTIFLLPAIAIVIVEIWTVRTTSTYREPGIHANAVLLPALINQTVAAIITLIGTVSFVFTYLVLANKNDEYKGKIILMA